MCNRNLDWDVFFFYKNFVDDIFFDWNLLVEYDWSGYWWCCSLWFVDEKYYWYIGGIVRIKLVEDEKKNSLSMVGDEGNWKMLEEERCYC